MARPILLVDDELAVLEGYRRLLEPAFTVDTADSGPGALANMEAGNEYAVVVADMRMPGMNGIELLRAISERFPNTVRVMLTGKADMETAISAVNQGNVFRFLTKPCPPSLFTKSLSDALEQHRLLTAEKELLQDTLTGAVRVLSEVLSLINPAAFGRAVRVQRYIRQVASMLPVANFWELEVAGLMSQLGCVTLHPDTIDAAYAGRTLDADEEARYKAHASVACDLLNKIPRLERVAWMIGQQDDGNISSRAVPDEASAFGAKLLQVLVAFDEACSGTDARREALRKVEGRFPNLDPALRRCLESISVEMEGAAIRTCSLEQLAPGMVAEQEVRTPSGMLVVARGQEVSSTLILKLKNLRQRGSVPATMVVIVPGTR